MNVAKKKQTILITGASQGIGAALAVLYAAQEVNLILIARNLTKLEKIKQLCVERHAHVIIKSIDVAHGGILNDFIIEIDDQMPLDLVITNAGIANTLKPNWHQEDKNESNSVWQTNLLGTVNTLEPVIKRMIARKKGQIALMSSIAGLRGLPQSPTYSASKAAIYSYGQSLRSWLRRYNIAVSIICPGYVMSAMSQQLNGPKPLMISTQQAAEIIKKGLEKNRACIAFPKRLYYLTLFANCLPNRLIDAVLNRYESYVE